MSELEEYRSQLKDIEDTLKQDPEKESLKELQKELQDLVSLLSQEEEQQQQEEQEPSKSATPLPPSSRDTTPSTSSGIDFKVGDIVYVKNKLDKEFKEVKITTISGNNKLITVKFEEDDKIDTYPIEDIYKEKPKMNKYRLKKQKLENQQLKSKESEKEMNKSVQSWKNFNSKKKKKIGINEKSQFKTSDNVGSKVGVVNSGRPMTETKKKERALHRYNPY